ncbi:MAG: hypothetical protein DHS20C16_33550 [Phycisphaerae bacterium]|nr:MAG: hypothetical protein DHS20C16_33550 [Phycisphaerae bacterium]
MTFELLQSLLKPGLVGGLVLLIGAVSGWGMSQAPEFVLTRFMRWWLLTVIVPLLKRPSWLLRSIVIFANNAGICMLLVACGTLPLVPWVAIAAVGVAMGAALRVLVTEFGWDAEADDQNRAVEISPAADSRSGIGMLLNLLEFPAIGLTLALALMQRELPIAAAAEPILPWTVMLIWTLPMLALAACGESLWMGRQGVFDR